MLLMTKELEKEFNNYRFGSQEGKEMDADVVVKYFNPFGTGTWLITEGEKQEDGDWLLYGYCHLFEWEWGYVLLSELERVRLPFGLGVEREIYDTGKKVRDYFY